MIKHYFLWIALSAVCLFFPEQAFARKLAAAPSAGKNLFISGSFGLSIPNTADWNEAPNLLGDIEFEKTTSFAGALGIRLSSYFSTEAEFSYRNTGLDELTVKNTGSAELNDDAKTWAGMLNAYLHIMPGSRISPYAMVGAGVARYQIDIDPVTGLGVTGASGTDTVAAYQWGGGLNYNMSENSQVWLGYRFFGTDRPVINTTELDYTVHEIMLGYRRHFGRFGED